ncbi:hypothetical protein Tco_1575613 [Tanacetum coccineum]
MQYADVHQDQYLTEISGETSWKPLPPETEFKGSILTPYKAGGPLAASLRAGEDCLHFTSSIPRGVVEDGIG